MTLGEKEIFTLLYAGDMVLIAKVEDEVKSMLERLERYIECKGLEINVRKTKIMRFR